MFVLITGLRTTCVSLYRSISGTEDTLSSFDIIRLHYSRANTANTSVYSSKSSPYLFKYASASSSSFSSWQPSAPFLSIIIEKLLAYFHISKAWNQGSNQIKSIQHFIDPTITLLQYNYISFFESHEWVVADHKG